MRVSLAVVCATEAEFARLMEAVTTALERGDWRGVEPLVPPLYAYVLRCGDGVAAELLEELYRIAREALALSVFPFTGMVGDGKRRRVR